MTDSTYTAIAFIIAQPVSFTDPSPSRTYFPNTGFDVFLSSNVIDSSNPLVTVTQQCGTDTQTYSDVIVGIGFSATAVVFVGSCTFSSSISGIYNAASPEVTITISEGSIAITEPSPTNRITAGTDTPISVTANPTISSLTVQLDCGGAMQATYSITPNSPTAQTLPVPATFYGTSCSFSVINYPSYYTAPAPVTVSIVQPVQFSEPEPNENFLINTEIDVLLTAEVINDTYPTTVTQLCGSNTQTYSNVKIGTSFTADIPSNFIGSCTFSSNAI